MGQGLGLSRGVRITGAAVCGLLATVVGAAVVRDLVELGLHDMLGGWFGISGPLGPTGRVTSLADGQLLVVYLAGLLAVWRSAVAGAFFAITGVLTVVLRAVILWTLLTRDVAGGIWGFPAGRWAVLTLSLGVGLGVVLVFVVLAGNKLSDHGYGQQGFGPPLGAAEGAAPPRAGNAVLASSLLGVAALATAGWQVYWIIEYGWDVYRPLLTGERSIGALTQPPSGIHGWALAVLLLLAAGAAIRRRPSSRPAGMIAGWLLLIAGVAKLVLHVEHDSLGDFDGVATAAVLDQLTAFYELAAGPLLLLLLAPREIRGAQLPPWQQGTGPVGGYGGGYGGYGGYAPPQDGRGW